jgi:hypothetical protein
MDNTSGPERFLKEIQGRFNKALILIYRAFSEIGGNSTHIAGVAREHDARTVAPLSFDSGQLNLVMGIIHEL